MIIPRSRSASEVPDVDKLPEEEVRRLARAYVAQKQVSGVFLFLAWIGY